MNKKTFFFCLPFFLNFFVGAYAQKENPVVLEIGETLDAWHLAAAEADFKTYFSLMSDSAIYIGTDPTENWTLKEFKAFAKPYFEQGEAWDFTPLERNIFLSESGEIAWFDELLETWMGICRGSGVLVKEASAKATASDGNGKPACRPGRWKIRHYVLSMTVPNEDVQEVITLKQEFDKRTIQQLQEKK